MMEKKNSLGMNFVMNIILTMSTMIFPLITFPYVSRVLLAEGNGKVQMASAFVSYFVMVSQLGIPTYGIRACSVVRDNRRELTKTVHELCMINVIMTLISSIALFLMIGQIPRLRSESTLYLVSSAAIFLNAVGMEWLFKGLEQYRYITIRSLVFKVIAVAAMFLLIQTQEDYVIYAGISVLASYGSAIFNLTQLHKFIDLKPVGGYEIKRHLKPVFVFFALTCAATIYTNLDSVMLGFMTTDADVGYYGVAVKVKNILVSIVTALGAVLLPRVSYYHDRGEEKEFRSVISKAMRFVLLLSFPMAIYFMIFARQSIFVLSGDTYGKSILPMIAIMPTLIFIGMTNIMGMQVLVPTGRERIVLYSTVAGAVTDVIVNAALIPEFQALGAAIGTLIAEGAVLAVQFVALKAERQYLFGHRSLLRIIPALMVGGLTSAWIGGLPLGNFLILILSAIVFFGAYLLVLHMTGEPLLLELERELSKRFFLKKEQG